MGISCKRAGAVLVMAVCTTAANADPITSEVSGFGTAAVTFADTNKAEFVRDNQPGGADKNASFDVDSLAGVQGTVHLDQQYSATGQLVLRRVVTAEYRLDVTTAFLKDQLTNDFAVRAGRLPLPLFMVSDYREVGFTNTFIRPPQEVYGASPVYSFEGVDSLYTHTFGPVEVDGQLYYGKYEFDGPAFTVTVRRAFGGNITATYGPLTLRYGRSVSHSTITSGADALIAGVAAAGFTQLADQLNTKNRASSFTGFGGSLDWRGLLVQAEATEAVTGGFSGRDRGQYALVGFRIQKFTPYVMYSRRQIISETSDDTIPQVGPLLPLALGVNAVLAKYDQHSSSAGIRWDFHDSMDLKLQYDHVSPQGPGSFANVQPGFRGPVNVAGLALDFVF